MSAFKFLSAFAITAALLLGSAVVRADEPRAIVVADYTVFVDPPTGFVFVKLPAGWKFVGQVSEQDIARLPGSVVTALLKPESEALQTARRDAALSRR